MKTVLHKAESRSRAEQRWLQSLHTFSFAKYHDPERMRFGALRVINDDIVAPAKGFDMHTHDNMEIISIPLSGSLRHEDSMGNTHLIQHGAIRINQEAWFSLGYIETGHRECDRLHNDGNGVYVFVIEGEADVAHERLGPRDGLGITESSEIEISATIDCELLVIEVPL